MNKDSLSIPGEYEVRRTWKILPVKSESKSEGVGEAPHNELGLRVLAPNALHVTTAQFGAKIIHSLLDCSLYS